MRKSERPGSVGDRARDALLAGVRRVSPRMRAINLWSFVVAVLLAVLTLCLMQSVLSTRLRVDQINEAYQTCQHAADDLQDASDFLTSQARLFVTTGDEAYLNNYLDEVQTRDRRGKAIRTLREHASSEAAVEALETARVHSDELSQVELYALRLTAESKGGTAVPQVLAQVRLTADDEGASSTQKRSQAHALVYGDDYTELKLSIRSQVNSCSTLLVGTLRNDLEETSAWFSLLITAMHASVISLLLVVAFVIASTTCLLLWPMRLHEGSIREDLPLEACGASELRHLVLAYNEMYDRNHDRTASLSYEADHDPLTGLLNRGAFEELLTEHKHDSALLLVDVDLFKHFNDDFGHDMGDAILIEVAATLYGLFRATDFIFRIGGDEFAVIATDMDESLRDVLVQKVEAVAEFLRDTSNGLPAVTVSVGIAFGSRGCADDDLFQRADRALYLTKRRGRDGYSFDTDVA